MANSAHRERVGAELRRIRESLSLAGEEVAASLGHGWSQSKISRIEGAKIGVSIHDLAKLLNFYGVPEEVKAELLTLTAEESGLEGAWIVRAGGTTRRQIEVGSIETRVQTFRQYHNGIVPGQLQSPSYARGIATLGGFADIDGIAVRRAARQELLKIAGAPEYHAILDSRALLYWPGDPAVLAPEQFDHLRVRIDLDSITVQLIPLDVVRRATAMVPFILYDFRSDSPPVAFIETQTADVYLSASDDVETYRGLFDRLCAEALSPEDSRNYLDLLQRDIDKIITR
ncbi:helix-turn-helix transcriptional regulator [Hamadaea sp. NPDC051192]|uniref:helix-turn-helix domain-containing protein n=1 Tax=Hamadaea sp. NPDC051192 TaxID=3154940 RepID=UPI0034431CCC